MYLLYNLVVPLVLRPGLEAAEGDGVVLPVGPLLVPRLHRQVFKPLATSALFSVEYSIKNYNSDE